MWNGNYNRWNPIPALEGKRTYIEAVHDDYEGLRIWLRSSSTEPMAIFRFSSFVAYFSSNESLRISKVEPKQTLEFPHAFWTVSESELARLVTKQSLDTLSDGCSHYAFLSADDCIDVLAFEPPEVTYEA